MAYRELAVVKIRLFHSGEPIDVTVNGTGPSRDVVIEKGEAQRRVSVEIVADSAPSGAIRLDGRAVRYLAERRGSRVFVALLGESYEFELSDAGSTRRSGHATASPETRSPMPGKVLQVAASVGLAVKPGDPLLILEAMKMENVLTAEIEGTVVEVHVKAGDMVEPGKLLVVVRAVA